jgi:hypothetical protein
LSQLPSNRTGTAFIVNYKIASSTRLGGSAHFYRAVSDPEDAVFLKRDYSIELSQKFLKQSIKLWFREKNRANAVESSLASEQKINSLRLEQRLPVNRAIGIQNRLELHWAKPLEENNRYYGINFFHQVDWEYQKKWRFLFRWSVFDVPDYALRIYEFEPDLPGNFRIVLLNGRGYKFMSTLRWRPLPFAQFDFKYQQRYYPDLESVGSGLDRIETNRVHEFRMSVVLSR